jgi:NADH-quinone oxidoreductase subunit J
VQIIFIIVSAIVLISAVIVVTNRNLFHAALALMVSFVGVAAMYVLLEAGFLAAAQLLIYVGAISVLILFAIMLTRRMMQTQETAYNSQWVWAAVTSFLVFGLLALVLLGTWTGTAGPPVVSAEVLRGSVAQMGYWLVSPDHYVIPFEVASILLLAALIGSIVIAMPEKKS